MCHSFTKQVPSGSYGVSSKVLAFNSSNSPGPQLSCRHKSPTLLWVVIAISSSFCFLVLFSFLFNRPQEGESCWSQPITDLLSVFRGEGTLGCQMCLCLGVLGTPAKHPSLPHGAQIPTQHPKLPHSTAGSLTAPQAQVLTPPLHSHPIWAWSLTASFHPPVSVLFSLLSSACFSIHKITGHLRAHQPAPRTPWGLTTDPMAFGTPPRAGRDLSLGKGSMCP